MDKDRVAGAMKTVVGTLKEAGGKRGGLKDAARDAEKAK